MPIGRKIKSPNLGSQSLTPLCDRAIPVRAALWRGAGAGLLLYIGTGRRGSLDTHARSALGHGGSLLRPYRPDAQHPGPGGRPTADNASDSHRVRDRHAPRRSRAGPNPVDIPF